MATTGDEQGKQLTAKQQVVLRKTADETGGALLEMQATYQPGGTFPPLHYHPRQDEHFEVLEGEIEVQIAGAQATFRAGQSFDIPRGTPHTFRNSGAEQASLIWQVRPALKTQQFYETLWGLAADGKTNQDGVPDLLQAAVLMQAYADEFVLASPPRVVQRPLFALLGWLGRLRGYRGRYERYSGRAGLAG